MKSDRLKFVALFDENFVYESEKPYVGFLHINVDRIKLAPVAPDLRRNGITCFSAPIVYKDHEAISMMAALDLASKHAKSLRASAVISGHHQKAPPVFWDFDLAHSGDEEEKSGGAIMVDRLDGHILTYSDYEEYLYDYNNVL